MHRAAFGRGVKLHVAERFGTAVKFAYKQVVDGMWGSSIWSIPGVMLVVCLVVTAVALLQMGPPKGNAAYLVLPLGAIVAFVVWMVVGLLRWEAGPPTGHLEVRDDALLCRFEDGSLVDMPWSEVVGIRAGDSAGALLVEHGAHEITELRGTPAEMSGLRTEMGAALERFLPVSAARRLLARGGKPISDWLASVRGKFQPGSYRSGPPPLSRDQLVRVLLCPRLAVDERIAAAAALSVLGGQERNGLSRLRIVTRQVESPALRIAAERAMEDALDEAAIAEAAAQLSHGARLPQG